MDLSLTKRMLYQLSYEGACRKMSHVHISYTCFGGRVGGAAAVAVELDRRLDCTLDGREEPPDPGLE